MSATPPETDLEYSRAKAGSRAVFWRRWSAARPRPAGRFGAIGVAVVGAGLLGSLLLLIAEFTALFEVHVATASAAIKSVSVGSHHSYAIALIAICAAALTTAVWRAGSRPALAAVGILGLAALLIALIHDLPDASKAGTARLAAHYVTAKATPSAGFYMETLGAVLLMFSSVWGLLLTGAPGPGRTPSAV